MSIHKYKDWRGWWDGLRSVAMKAGAESVYTNLAALVGSNGVTSLIPALHDYALNWHTACVTTGTQFIFMTFKATAKYIRDKPDPDVIVEECDSNPNAFVKSADGTIISNENKITPTTPTV